MFETVALTLDFSGRHATSQAIVHESSLPFSYVGDRLPGLVVVIEDSTYFVIDPSKPTYQLNASERDAMDRAFWRSVSVIDEGYEG